MDYIPKYLLLYFGSFTRTVTQYVDHAEWVFHTEDNGVASAAVPVLHSLPPRR